MINNQKKIYIVFILLSIFTVPNAYSLVNIDQHDYICKIDKNQPNQNNGKYETHCEQCYFYFDDTDQKVLYLTELVTVNNISINNYQDFLCVLKRYFKNPNTRAPPIV